MEQDDELRDYLNNNFLDIENNMAGSIDSPSSSPKKRRRNHQNKEKYVTPDGTLMIRFATLNEGSYINFSGFLLQHDSIFAFKAETNVTTLTLSKDDFMKVAQKQEIVLGIVASNKALYGKNGNDFDFGRQIYQNLNEIKEVQKNKKRIMNS